MIPVYTAFFFSVQAALLLWLAMRVIGYRRSRQIAFGDHGDAGLLRLIRAHANGVEYMLPMGLLMLLTEMMGAVGGESGWLCWLWLTLVSLFTIGRFFHAYGMSKPKIGPRVLGMHLTLWPMLAMILLTFVMAVCGILT